MSIVLKAENISKQYRLGTVGSGTIKDDLARWWYKSLGKEDPLLKIGETNDRTQKGNSDYVWAIKDINFEVQQGEVLGIIGRNGAGKSTLLKILSKVTAPTTGQVKVNGRIASLLEVGTGFHPELTGKENIYLNGAILGMRKHEITKQLDEIIAFAGVERYLDTPVKRYSSGMYVRLAFAVAAHLDSEILIVDEVLAVGDAEFQQKCLGKMKDISGNGRTVLFVSHNMSAIKNLCSKGILISKSKIDFLGDVKTTVEKYRFENNSNEIKTEYYNNNEINGVTWLKVITSSNSVIHNFNEPLEIEIRTKFNKKYNNPAVALQIKNENEISVLNPLILNNQLKWYLNNEGYLKLRIEKPRLYLGKYTVSIHIGDKSSNEHIQSLEDIISFEIKMDNIFSEYDWKVGNATYMEDTIWITNNNSYENKF